MTRIVYLHGFASSPHSSKAQFFARKFAACGVSMEIPQLDEGHFEELTISGQLRVIECAVGDEPAILIGSSLGGYLAALYASRHAAQIEKLVYAARRGHVGAVGGLRPARGAPRRDADPLDGRARVSIRRPDPGQRRHAPQRDPFRGGLWLPLRNHDGQHR